MFQLNGNANGTTREKNDWPLEVVAKLIKKVQTGTETRAAFREVVEEYNATGPKTKLFVPPSVEGEYPASVFWGMKKRFEKKANNPKSKEMKQVQDLIIQYGIGADVPATS